MVEIRTCKKCGFILDTRPGLKSVDGICLACINHAKKKEINFEERQEWLKGLIKNAKTTSEYDCAVAVSGGKDSCAMVKRLIQDCGCKNPLLIHISDEFTKTQAGIFNLNNLVKTFNLDIIEFRMKPGDFIDHIRKDFFNELHPLKYVEKKIETIPAKLALDLHIPFLFYGENPAFEYGSSEELNVFHPASTDALKIIYLGAVYPYSIKDSLNIARSIGFRDLDYYNEWQRQGCIENYTQIDSKGYLMHLWAKFVKFGFQRVSDMACRFVRDGILTKEEAEFCIREKDYICDPEAKKDFCRTIEITEQEFDETVDKFANQQLVKKDVLGQWRRRDQFPEI